MRHRNSVLQNMLGKTQKFSNFSNALHTTSICFRPDNEKQLSALLSRGDLILARGKGLSYSDCCLNDNGVIVDTSRLNHLISFDDQTGVLVCQGGVNFADLFSLHTEYIPPVIPGTLKATIAGGIANDVHGKNNHREGCFGHHILWLELQINHETVFCNKEHNSDLFYGTIGGLGLTGIIKRVAIKMRKASHYVNAHSEKFQEIAPLLERMKTHGLEYDYQVAWLDLLNKPRALLSLANHCEGSKYAKTHTFGLPKMPWRCIYNWPMKQFNRWYFNKHRLRSKILPLIQFNNPLDAISNWNFLYGKKGLLQFQALIPKDITQEALDYVVKIIRQHKATPTLSVLKYFNQPGLGPLSFAEPGFTIAIDFINNVHAEKAIAELNQWITELSGKVYLAKDLLLTTEQFKAQYLAEEQYFSQLLKKNRCTIHSNLSQRLGIT